MQRKWSWILLFGAVFGGAALYTRDALATPSSGFAATTLAMGRFGEIDVFNHFILSNALPEPNGHIWMSLQKTKGSSDVYVQNTVWQPGGSSGWHTHPGYSLIIVTTGAVTAYEGSDPDCKPRTYTEGMGFVDPGGDHVHLLRNEGTVIAGTVAVQFTPADATRRIDVEDPGNCRF